MARGYSITLVVGSGFPGHASIQINSPERTLYTGFGPNMPGVPIWKAGHDTVDLPNGARESLMRRLLVWCVATNDPDGEVLDV